MYPIAAYRVEFNYVASWDKHGKTGTTTKTASLKFSKLMTSENTASESPRNFLKRILAGFDTVPVWDQSTVRTMLLAELIQSGYRQIDEGTERLLSHTDAKISRVSFLPPRTVYSIVFDSGDSNPPSAAPERVFTVKNREIRMFGENWILVGKKFIEIPSNGNNCVAEALVHLYGKLKGLIKKCRNLDAVCAQFGFKSVDEMNTHGISTEMLATWCQNTGLNMVALDSRGNAIATAVAPGRQQDRISGSKALIFYRIAQHIHILDPLDPSFTSIIKSHHVTKRVPNQKTYTKDDESTKIIAIDNYEMDFDSKTIYNVKDLWDCLKHLLNKKIIPKAKFLSGYPIELKVGKAVIFGPDRLSGHMIEVIDESGVEYRGGGLPALLKTMYSDWKMIKSDIYTHEMERIFYSPINWERHVKLVELQPLEMFSYDLDGAYYNAIIKNTEPWCIFNATCSVTNQTRLLEPGLYHISFDHPFLPLFMRRTGGWFYRHTCEYISKLTEITITHYLRPSSVLECDHFNLFFEDLLEKFPDPHEFKLVRNQFIGLLRKKSTSFDHNVFFGTNDEVQLLCETHAARGELYCNEQITDSIHVGYTRKSAVEPTNGVPISKQVIENNDQSLCTLYQALGCPQDLVSINIDELVFRRDHGAVSCGIDYKTKTNPWFPLNYPVWTCPKFEQWRRYPPIINPVKEIRPMASMMVLGRCGTGKSTLIREFNIDNKYVLCAHYNKAARNIGGVTLCSLLSVNISTDQVDFKMIYRSKGIIIDECSQIPYRIWRHLVQIRHLMPWLPMIICGDWNQCPPVENDLVNYSTLDFIKELTHGNILELTENKRSDSECWDIQSAILNGDSGTFNLSHSRPTNINLVRTNVKRKELNSKFNTSGRLIPVKECQCSPSQKCCWKQSMRIEIGVPLICYKTMQHADGVINCWQGNVIAANDTETTISDGIISVTLNDSKLIGHFLLAYAITVDRAQGDTIDKDFRIWEWSKMCKSRRYTAIGRTTRANLIDIQIF